MTEIRVLVCDDDLLARRAIVEYLQCAPDFVVSAVPDADGAIAAVAAAPVDVVLLDIGMPGMNGVDAVPHLRRAAPATKVLMLTALDDPDRVSQALNHGACGFLLKDVSPDTLIEAVRSAHKGLRVLSPGPLQQIMGLRTGPKEPQPELNERERTVLDLLCAGASNAQIASTLYLSPSSVKATVSTLMTKLNATSRLHAVARAHELHLDR